MSRGLFDFGRQDVTGISMYKAQSLNRLHGGMVRLPDKLLELLITLLELLITLI